MAGQKMTITFEAESLADLIGKVVGWLKELNVLHDEKPAEGGETK